MAPPPPPHPTPPHPTPSHPTPPSLDGEDLTPTASDILHGHTPHLYWGVVGEGMGVESVVVCVFVCVVLIASSPLCGFSNMAASGKLLPGISYAIQANNVGASWRGSTFSVFSVEHWTLIFTKFHHAAPNQQNGDTHLDHFPACTFWGFSKT